MLNHALVLLLFFACTLIYMFGVICQQRLCPCNRFRRDAHGTDVCMWAGLPCWVIMPVDVRTVAALIRATVAPSYQKATRCHVETVGCISQSASFSIESLSIIAPGNLYYYTIGRCSLCVSSSRIEWRA